MSFKAFRIHQKEKGVRVGFEKMEISDLTPGDVVVRVQYSGINYKDALAATGSGRILRAPALNGGIDLAGEVMSSESDQFHAGDQVLACGCGLSETADGGYAEYAQVTERCLFPLPKGLTGRDAMALGTAGFTAALALIRMEENGQNTERGPILVTGASGGVGSIAIDLFAARGYEVVALTGKQEAHDYLHDLGARKCIDRNAMEMGTRPLEKALWAGAVDNTGGDTLAWLTRTVQPWGNIASIGLAGGVKLETTVMPFILRGVSLLGINSIEMPLELQASIWQRLGTDLKPVHLDRIAGRTITFDELPEAFDAYMSGSVIGRTVVEIGA